MVMDAIKCSTPLRGLIEFPKRHALCTELRYTTCTFCIHIMGYDRKRFQRIGTSSVLSEYFQLMQMQMQIHIYTPSDRTMRCDVNHSRPGTRDIPTASYFK